MSDGPYKSLPMMPRWRHAAKCAYKEAYSQEEIVESVARACHADWRSEVRSSLVASATAIVSPSGQQALFTDQMLADLADMRRRCTSPMEAAFVHNVIDAIEVGMVASGAVRFAAKEAMSDRLLRNYRQVEEHVRRDDSIGNARYVRDRFEAAHCQIDLVSLARAALRTGQPLVRRARTQLTALDAGVPL